MVLQDSELRRESWDFEEDGRLERLGGAPASTERKRKGDTRRCRRYRASLLGERLIMTGFWNSN